MIAEYTAKGYWSPTPLSELWDRNARISPGVEAIVDSRTRLTWAGARTWIDRLASQLVDMGLERDEMIVAQLPNCVELSLLRVACEKAGVLLMQLLPALRRNEVEGILERVEPAGVVVPQTHGDRDYLGMIRDIRSCLPRLRHIFVDRGRPPPGAVSLREVMETAAALRSPAELSRRTIPGTDFFLVIHTSGTTGFPKFAEHPMCSRLSTFRHLAGEYGITAGDTVSILGPAPASYNGFGYFAAPAVGARTVILERFDARETLRTIEKERITVLGLVPAQLQMMLNDPDFRRHDLSSVKIVCCMGAPLPRELAVAAEAAISACRVVQSYGGVDSGAITYTPLEDPPGMRFGTVGVPFPGTEIKLCNDSGQELKSREPGIIWARGPCLSSGFYRDEKQTWEVWTTDGYTNTGDVGKRSESGHLVIMGRSKDVIIRGGQNIYPAEIEAMLFAHPRIAGVAIVGMPDTVLGEKACACVVVRNGEKLTFDEMISYLKRKEIASFKLPERLEIIDHMPVVADTQKVDKKSLQKDIAEKVAREAESGEGRSRVG